MAHALTDDHDHRDIDDRLLPWPKVKDITGLSRTTAWRLQKTGDFPLPVVISPGRVGWRESELLVWKASRAPRGMMTIKPQMARSFAAPAATPAPGPSSGAIVPQPSATPRPSNERADQKQKPGQLRFEF